MASDLTGETVELLQTLIRNECVNDGTAESGFETRNADVLQTYVEGAGVDIERWEPTPGRASFVARIPGTDPSGAVAVPDGPHRRRAGQRRRLAARPVRRRADRR